MDSEKCSILLKSVELNSISKTADLFGYTVSGISRSITALEEEIGLKLVNRNRNGISLTEEGKALLPFFQELVEINKKINIMAKSIKGIEVGSLNIGSSYDVYHRWLTGLIADYFKDHQGITVKTVSNASSALKEELDNHKLDLCVMSRREGNYQWLHLKWDRLVVMVSKNHPFAYQGYYPVGALKECNYIDIYPGIETDNSIMLERNNITPKIRFSCQDGIAAIPIVESGLGVCVINELIADTLVGDFVCLPLEPVQHVEIGIAIPNSTTASPIVKDFLNYINKHKDLIK